VAKRQSPRSIGQACIYTRPEGLCKGDQPINDEHDMPVAFGEFHDDPPLRKICGDCNGSFGRELLDVLGHHSAEALRRLQLGVKGRKTHRPKPILFEGTKGLPPIPIIGKTREGSPDVLWGADSEDGGAPLPQIEFERPDGTRFRYPIAPEIRDRSELLRRLERAGLADSKPVSFLFAGDDCARFMELCGVKDENIVMTEYSAGGELVTVTGVITVDDRYLRAVAAIAFHLFMKSFDCFSGLEPDFDEIKRFIYSGEKGGSSYPWATLGRTRPLMNDVAGRVFSGPWGHAALVAYGRWSADARLDFFFSAKLPPIMWDVKIATRRSALVNEGLRAFVYLADQQPTGKFAGRRIEVTSHVAVTG
jgi:hypothetical protein